MGGVSRRCYNTGGSSEDEAGRRLQSGPGMSSLDQDVCFTQRAGDADKDAIFSVSDFEEMMWAEHAGTIGNNPDSMVDMYTENHYAQPFNSAGLTKLASRATSLIQQVGAFSHLAWQAGRGALTKPTLW